MRLSDHEDATPVARPGLADRVLGAMGAAMIATTLAAVRLWACVTRTPYYRD